MCDISVNGSKVTIGTTVIDFKYDLLDAFILENVAVVLIDPDSYIGDRDVTHNLLGYDLNGAQVWKAEFPQDYKADYYWRIVSRNPLVASTYSSFTCQINSLTGKIESTRFYK
jgi:hypothetical protein